MKYIALFILIFSVSVLAKGPGEFPPSSFESQYVARGDLLILKFVPEAKSGKVFFAGSKIADLDFNKDAKLLSVVMLKDNEREILKLSNDGSYYEVKTKKSFTDAYQLIFQTEVRGKKEELKLQIGTGKP